MKAYYGIRGEYTDVTDILESRISNRMIDMENVRYNDIFGDTLPLVSKHLMIEDESLDYPIYIDEDTSFSCWIDNLKSINNLCDKYYLVSLNAGLFAGLTNQLLALVTSLVIAKMCGRKVVVRGFHPDYNKERTIHIGEVIDLDSFNKYLSRHNTSVYDIRDMKYIRCWPASNYMRPQDRIPRPITLDGIISTMNEMQKDGYPHLDIGYTFEMGTFLSSPAQEIADLHGEICRNIVFNSTLRTSIDGVYHACHIRLEDDMLDLHGKTIEGYNEQERVAEQFSRYKEWILSKKEPVYISTGLGKYTNRYNHLLDELKHANIIMSTSLGKGREIDAAVDMNVCMNSESFMGSAGSTFSIIICDNLKLKGKNCILENIA